MNYYKDCSDKELMRLLWVAEETEDGRFIKAIKKELARRNRDE